MGKLAAVPDGTIYCGISDAIIEMWAFHADLTTHANGMFTRSERVAALVANAPSLNVAKRWN
ncbi:hypothetical protein [Paracoccus sp. Ld10]|uniref:hypothetical protein n=1 Tax=Paracoccus sp. Ld10 TaxID=649158 RepID=UPI003864449D